MGWRQWLVFTCLMLGYQVANAMTGIKPGDIVVSNIGVRAGHAGIYLGRWKMLPERIQRRYASTLDKADFIGGVLEMRDSYLVVDSMPSRGVRVASFAEEFTGLHGVNAGRYPKVGIDLDACSDWANQRGMAIQLSLSNEMRVRVIEEALKLAEKEVPYDLTHMQADTTDIGRWLERAGARSLKLDCIAMCTYVYEKAVGLDIDVSWKPWHTPTQLYDHFYGTTIAVKVNFSPVKTDAAFLGLWNIIDQSYSTAGMSDTEISAMKEALWLPKNTQFEVRRTSNKMVYDLIEVRPTEQLEPTLLTFESRPIEGAPYGFATVRHQDSNTTLDMGFIPLDAWRAQILMRATAGKKRMTVRVKLERKRLKLDLP